MNNWKLIALWSLLGSMSIAAPAMSSTLAITGLDQGDYTQTSNANGPVTTTINAAITSVNVDLVADVASNVCKLQNIVTVDRLASAVAEAS